jgi:hypothetical protein
MFHGLLKEIVFLFVLDDGKYKNRYLSSNLQEGKLQIALSGERTNC